MIESCTGCLYDLGGGRDNCCLGVAAECRDGGGYEAWTDAGKYSDVVHGNCQTEQVFEFCGKHDGFCCVGKRLSNQPQVGN